MTVKHPAEILFETALARLGASSGTFYIRDPYWSGDLRLVYMPGVKYREPMHGFLIPETAKRMVTAGRDEEYFRKRSDWDRFQTTDISPKILSRFPFFWRLCTKGKRWYVGPIHQSRH